VLPPGFVSAVYMPGARRPGWACFAQRLVCRPDWDYRLFSGPVRAAHRLTVFASDWDGNASALAEPLSRRRGEA
jgi:hypothetical protein